MYNSDQYSPSKSLSQNHNSQADFALIQKYIFFKQWKTFVISFDKCQFITLFSFTPSLMFFIRTKFHTKFLHHVELINSCHFLPRKPLDCKIHFDPPIRSFDARVCIDFGRLKCLLVLLPVQNTLANIHFLQAYLPAPLSKHVHDRDGR